MKKTLKKIALPLIIIALGVVIMNVFAKMKEKPEVVGSTVKLPVVEVKSFVPAEIALTVNGTGVVKPVNAVSITPRVQGEIMFLSPKLEKGGTFSKGELMVRIDPEDYQLKLKSAEAGVLMQQILYKTELQKANIARAEWEEFSSDNPGQVPEELTLRIPQLKLAEANLKAAEAGQELAELALKRSEVRAPFNCKVTKRNVSLGQFTSPGQIIASINSYKEGMVIVAVKRDEVAWLSGFGSKNSPNAIVKGHYGGKEIQWSAYLVSMANELDQASRMVDLVVYLQKDDDIDPVFNLFTDIEIAGKKVQDCVALPRHLVHKDGRISVLINNKLKFKNIETLRISGDTAYVHGIDSTDVLIMTSMQHSVEGMEVIVKE